MISCKLNLKTILIISEICIFLLLMGSCTTNGDATNTFGDFYVERERKGNWFQAFNNCSARRMNLVILDSQEKTEALTGELKKIFGSDHPNIWIGGNDNAKTGQFVWIKTNKQFDYANWAPRQPDNKEGKEHCVMLWSEHNYLWNDGNCLSKLVYVCEKKR
ncbi:salivary C-type lectin 2-like [Haematobia irritans]|uniref:salivary C-type lectin 2-like n=1 Tax=Haematobia irritans TaxID=7368 RepID=UPI003F4F63A9